jgi:hypothetical protein
MSFNHFIQTRDPATVKKLVAMLEMICIPFLKLKEVLTKRKKMLWTIVPKNIVNVKIYYMSQKYEYDVKFGKKSLVISSKTPEDNPYTLNVTTDKNTMERDFDLFVKYAASVSLYAIGVELLSQNNIKAMRKGKYRYNRSNSLDKSHHVFQMHETTFSIGLDNNILQMTSDNLSESQKRFLTTLTHKNMLTHSIESGVPPERAFLSLLQLLYLPGGILRQFLDAINDVNSTSRKVSLMFFSPLPIGDTSSEILQELRFPSKVMTTLKASIVELFPPGSRLVLFTKVKNLHVYSVIIRIRDEFSNKYVDVPIRMHAQPGTTQQEAKYVLFIGADTSLQKSGDQTLIGDQLVRKATDNEIDILGDFDREVDDNVLRRLLKSLCEMDIEEIIDIQ